MRALLASTACLLLMAAALPPPVLPEGQPAPVAHPYDETADAHAAVAAAFARAHASGHDVLLDFGGNWCPDCRMLAGVLEMAQVQAWSAAHLETVYIDVGRYTKNVDLAEQYGVKLHAAPTVVVVTPDGRVLNPGQLVALANARRMSAQAVVDLLASWVRS